MVTSVFLSGADGGAHSKRVLFYFLADCGRGRVRWGLVEGEGGAGGGCTFLPPAFLTAFLGDLPFLGEALATFLGEALAAAGEAALAGDFLAAALAIVMFVVGNYG